MTDHVDVAFDDDPDLAAADPAAAAPPAGADGQPRRPGGTSILDAIAAEARQETEGHTKVLPVGPLQRLFARYRLLDDDELEQITKRVQVAERQRRRVTRDKDGGDVDLEPVNHRHALLMATACVELLVEDEDGQRTPLHEVPGAESDTPYRFDSRLVALLGLADTLGLDATAGMLEVTMAMHGAGPLGKRSYAPLRTLGGVLDQWTTQVKGDALQEALGGM